MLAATHTYRLLISAQFVANMTQGTQQVRRALRSVQHELQSTRSHLKEFGALAGGGFGLMMGGQLAMRGARMIVQAYALIGKAIIKVGAEFEQFKVQYEFLYGPRAEAMWRRTKKVAVESLFTTKELIYLVGALGKFRQIDPFKQFANRRGEMQAAVETMADLVALNPGKTMSDMVVSMSQLLGEPGARRFYSLWRRFDVPKEIINKIKADITETTKAADVFAVAMKHLTKEFGGVSRAAQQTVSWAWRQIPDLLQLIGEEIFRPMQKRIHAMVWGLYQYLYKILRNKQFIASAAKAFEGLVKIIEVLYGVFMGVLGILQKLISTEGFGKFIIVVGGAIAAVLGLGGAFVATIGHMVLGIATLGALIFSFKAFRLSTLESTLATEAQNVALAEQIGLMGALNASMMASAGTAGAAGAAGAARGGRAGVGIADAAITGAILATSLKPGLFSRAGRGALKGLFRKEAGEVVSKNPLYEAIQKFYAERSPVKGRDLEYMGDLLKQGHYGNLFGDAKFWQSPKLVLTQKGLDLYPGHWPTFGKAGEKGKIPNEFREALKLVRQSYMVQDPGSAARIATRGETALLRELLGDVRGIEGLAGKTPDETWELLQKRVLKNLRKIEVHGDLWGSANKALLDIVASEGQIGTELLKTHHAFVGKEGKSIIPVIGTLLAGEGQGQVYGGILSNKTIHRIHKYEDTIKNLMNKAEVDVKELYKPKVVPSSRYFSDRFLPEYVSGVLSTSKLPPSPKMLEKALYEKMLQAYQQLERKNLRLLTTGQLVQPFDRVTADILLGRLFPEAGGVGGRSRKPYRSPNILAGDWWSKKKYNRPASSALNNEWFGRGNKGYRRPTMYDLTSEFFLRSPRSPYTSPSIRDLNDEFMTGFKFGRKYYPKVFGDYGERGSRIEFLGNLKEGTGFFDPAVREDFFGKAIKRRKNLIRKRFLTQVSRRGYQKTGETVLSRATKSFGSQPLAGLLDQIRADWLAHSEAANIDDWKVVARQIYRRSGMAPEGVMSAERLYKTMGIRGAGVSTAAGLDDAIAMVDTMLENMISRGAKGGVTGYASPRSNVPIQASVEGLFNRVMGITTDYFKQRGIPLTPEKVRELSAGSELASMIKSEKMPNFYLKLLPEWMEGKIGGMRISHSRAAFGMAPLEASIAKYFSLIDAYDGDQAKFLRAMKTKIDTTTKNLLVAKNELETAYGSVNKTTKEGKFLMSAKAAFDEARMRAIAGETVGADLTDARKLFNKALKDYDSTRVKEFRKLRVAYSGAESLARSAKEEFQLVAALERIKVAGEGGGPLTWDKFLKLRKDWIRAEGGQTYLARGEEAIKRFDSFIKGIERSETSFMGIQEAADTISRGRGVSDLSFMRKTAHGQLSSLTRHQSRALSQMLRTMGVTPEQLVASLTGTEKGEKMSRSLYKALGLKEGTLTVAAESFAKFVDTAIDEMWLRGGKKLEDFYKTLSNVTTTTKEYSEVLGRMTTRTRTLADIFFDPQQIRVMKATAFAGGPVAKGVKGVKLNTWQIAMLQWMKVMDKADVKSAAQMAAAKKSPEFMRKGFWGRFAEDPMLASRLLGEETWGGVRKITKPFKGLGRKFTSMLPFGDWITSSMGRAGAVAKGVHIPGYAYPALVKELKSQKYRPTGRPIFGPAMVEGEGFTMTMKRAYKKPGMTPLKNLSMFTEQMGKIGKFALRAGNVVGTIFNIMLGLEFVIRIVLDLYKYFKAVSVSEMEGKASGLIKLMKMTWRFVDLLFSVFEGVVIVISKLAVAVIIPAWKLIKGLLNLLFLPFQMLGSLFGIGAGKSWADNIRKFSKMFGDTFIILGRMVGIFFDLISLGIRQFMAYFNVFVAKPLQALLGGKYSPDEGAMSRWKYQLRMWEEVLNTIERALGALMNVPDDKLFLRKMNEIKYMIIDVFAQAILIGFRVAMENIPIIGRSFQKKSMDQGVGALSNRLASMNPEERKKLLGGLPYDKVQKQLSVEKKAFWWEKYGGVVSSAFGPIGGLGWIAKKRLGDDVLDRIGKSRTAAFPDIAERQTYEALVLSEKRSEMTKKLNESLEGLVGATGELIDSTKENTDAVEEQTEVIKEQIKKAWDTPAGQGQMLVNVYAKDMADSSNLAKKLAEQFRASASNYKRHSRFWSEQ